MDCIFFFNTQMFQLQYPALKSNNTELPDQKNVENEIEK